MAWAKTAPLKGLIQPAQMPSQSVKTAEKSSLTPVVSHKMRHFHCGDTNTITRVEKISLLNNFEKHNGVLSTRGSQRRTHELLALLKPTSLSNRSPALQ